MSRRFSTLLGILILVATLCAASVVWKRFHFDCGQDALANIYAQRLSQSWGAGLTDAFVSIEEARLQELLGYSLSSAQHDRLTTGYSEMVEKYYAKDVWLPGVRGYVDKHLSKKEQCSVLSYYESEIGLKVFDMQVTAGELEFVRQQATNSRRANPEFERDRTRMLERLLPEIDKSVLAAGPVP